MFRTPINSIPISFARDSFTLTLCFGIIHFLNPRRAASEILTAVLDTLLIYPAKSLPEVPKFTVKLEKAPPCPYK